MERLYKKLESYGQSDYYPFHMPGHKRNRASSADDFLFERDITEISGFDNLHHAEGILKEAQEYAAQIYGTKKCFFSVNGSTAALLAAVSASVNKGGKILVARNCHKAVYHALYLRELQPVYIYPHEDQRLGINGGISPERVERYLEENTDVQALLLTSPTYDGVVSDIKTIAEVVHRHKIPLIVDEAHGAHFHYSKYFPVSAADLGADIVIQSFHKITLYPESVWNEELNELRSRLNKWNSKHQLIFRQFVSDVEIVTPDSNGRILIPKRYLQICSIHGDIRFIGIDNKIEIWAKERAEQPFMSPEEFGAALEEIMNDDNRQDGER